MLESFVAGAASTEFNGQLIIDRAGPAGRPSARLSANSDAGEVDGRVERLDKPFSNVSRIFYASD